MWLTSNVCSSMTLKLKLNARHIYFIVFAHNIGRCEFRDWSHNITLVTKINRGLQNLTSLFGCEHTSQQPQIVLSITVACIHIHLFKKPFQTSFLPFNVGCKVTLNFVENFVQIKCMMIIISNNNNDNTKFIECHNAAATEAMTMTANRQQQLWDWQSLASNTSTHL